MLPTLEQINSIPKTIDDNGCWIPKQKPYGGRTKKYVLVSFNYTRYFLSRLSMCIFKGLDYNDYKFHCRHSDICDLRCFNPEHLQPGTQSDNEQDKIRQGRNHNLNKDKCPKCNSSYIRRVIRSGPSKGKVSRVCYTCKNRNRRR